jgi:hypothetical protein
MSGEKDAASSATPQQGKYSRYRSVRHPPAKAYPPAVEVIPLGQGENSNAMGRTKSMSRYRRSRIGSPEQSNDPPPPMPAMSPGAKLDTSAALPGNQRTRRVTEPATYATQQQPSPPVERSGTKLRTPGRRETEDERLRRKVQEFREREAQKARAEEQKTNTDEIGQLAQRKAEEAQLARERKIQADAHAEELRLKEEETARLLAEQKQKDLERLEATLDAAGPRTPGFATPKEKFNFFSRKRATSKVAPPRTSGSGSGGTLSSTRTRSIEVTAPKEVKKPRNASPPSRRVAREPIKLAQPLAPEQMIQEGGGGIVPQIDAPISASNAGERVSFAL